MIAVVSTDPVDPPVRLVIALTGDIDVDELVADHCWVNGVMGIEEREHVILATFEKADGAHQARTLISQLFDHRGIAADIVTETVLDDGWLDAWRPHAQIIEAGRFVVRPPWLVDDDVELRADDTIQIELDPGHAFGSGSHASTRLALRAIERAVDRLAVTPNRQLLDVGCGSGVLAIAGLRLGIDHAVAIDVDPAAIIATEANAARNGVAERVDASTQTMSNIGQTFELVAANVLAPVLRELADHLVARLAIGGRLVISGVLIDQVDDVVQHLTGLTVEDQITEDGWAAAILAQT